MSITYTCCKEQDIKYYKAYTDKKGCVVMCPDCHTILASVGFHPDGNSEQGWISQAIKNNMYYANKKKWWWLFPEKERRMILSGNQIK
jgi:hypothetical protein